MGKIVGGQVMPKEFSEAACSKVRSKNYASQAFLSNWLYAIAVGVGVRYKPFYYFSGMLIIYEDCVGNGWSDNKVLSSKGIGVYLHYG